MNDCYADGDPRIFPVSKGVFPQTNSRTFCRDLCAGYTYTGLQNGQDCWCSNTLPSSEHLRPLSECSKSCPANNAEFCGAPFRMSVMFTGSFSSVSVVDCSDFGECSASCGGGIRTCSRTCNYGSFGSIACPADLQIKKEPCNLHQCRKLIIF